MAKTEDYFRKRAELSSKLSVEEEIKVLAYIDDMYVEYTDILIADVRDLFAPFTREDGSLDVAMIDRARLEDNQFNRKLMRFQKQIDITTREIAKFNEEKTTALLENTYYKTAKESLEVIQQYKSFNMNDLDILNKKAIAQIIKEPWTTDKITFSKRVWNNAESLNRVLRQEITYGMVSGRSIHKTVKEIEDIMGANASAVSRLVRTENSHIYNQAAVDSYKALDLDKYKYLTGGTSKKGKEVCPVCAALNGKIFFVKDAEAGVNLPPSHPNCRCTTIPFF